MKNWIKIFCLLAVVSFSNVAHADENNSTDTVYFYETWGQMLDMTPAVMVISPVIEAVTPFEIDIYTTSDDYRLLNYRAASIGDSIWLVSGKYLNNAFQGDTRDLSYDKFYPIFFNEKVAYMVALSYDDDLSLKDILFGTTDDYEPVAVFYYMDFRNRKLKKVTPKVLSELLEDYHDLQMRYEGMKNYKNREIIEDYFYKFVDRATDDIMRPKILDLVAN